MRIPLVVNLILLIAITAFGQKERNAIEEQYKWNLSHLYQTDHSWEESKNKLVAEMSQ